MKVECVFWRLFRSGEAERGLVREELTLYNCKWLSACFDTLGHTPVGYVKESPEKE